jgi:hypothetical protein
VVLMAFGITGVGDGDEAEENCLDEWEIHG